MRKYQQAFQRTHGVKWGFMDESLINRYLTFKNAKIKMEENLKRKVKNEIMEDYENFKGIEMQN